VVVESAQEKLAETVYMPANVQTAALVIAICGDAQGRDVGRCAQKHDAVRVERRRRVVARTASRTRTQRRRSAARR